MKKSAVCKFEAYYALWLSSLWMKSSPWVQIVHLPFRKEWIFALSSKSYKQIIRQASFAFLLQLIKNENAKFETDLLRFEIDLVFHLACVIHTLFTKTIHTYHIH